MIPEVDWLIDVLSSVADAQPGDHPLHRVDRDTGQVYETGEDIDMTEPMPKRVAYLKRANLVGIRTVDQSNEPIGDEFNARTDQVFSIRLEGMHYAEYGHIDPNGANAVDFNALTNSVQEAIRDERHHPSVPGSSISHHYDLRITNESWQLADWRDFYRVEMDVLFRGREEL